MEKCVNLLLLELYKMALQRRLISRAPRSMLSLPDAHV